MDRGATERNVDVNMIALQRAAQRNGGQNQPTYPPASVTGDDGGMPSQAVNRVGPNGGE